MDMLEEARRRIIVALDFPELAHAQTFAQDLRKEVGRFPVKIGLELMSGAPGPAGIAERFTDSGCDVFVDGKWKDIANTVEGVSRQVLACQPWMFNVHVLGTSRPALEAAARIGKEHESLAIGVTLLTDVVDKDLAEQGFFDPISDEAFPTFEQMRRQRRDNLVRSLARFAKSCGLDGVVASAQEAAVIREACGPEFLIVTPGIRPAWAAANDQKRITTPADAIRAGADYLVVGRPITAPPADIGTPAEAFRRIATEVAEALEA